MSTPTSGSSVSAAIYEERLWPAPWIWLVAAGAAGASVVTFAPINLTTGIIAAVVVAVVLGTLLILSTPRIIVSATHLTVGRATIERRYLGTASAYRGEDATAQRGPALNATAYLCIRGWISPVVRVEITDPADSTPYWLTSTRRPDALIAALAR
ncbi:DUF3093 domain-containing protein [Arthrobacter sp. H20]|uniref:DUF3093 domain-containing protein n=1 Tax=Arthrobacter sp. H20 TaxID=1267981 RepID=UPI00047B655A|nr:DUF3093 domain-containing protein [Arthrobacter sp. H20]